MTDALSPQPPPSDADRNLALAGYALLFAAIFFAGAPALVALVLAYVRRGKADAVAARHFNGQIRIFWVAFGLSLAAGVCGLSAAVIGLRDMWLAGYGGEIDGWDMVAFDWNDLHLEPAAVVLTVAALALSLLTAIWLLVTAGIGFFRLLGQTPPTAPPPAKQDVAVA